MKRTGLIFSTMALGALLFSSCRKEPLTDMTEDESRIYVTNYDQQADFNSYKTFSIVDSVAVASNGGGKKELTDYDTKLLASIRSNFQARGYTLVDRSASPDLAVNVSRINTTNTQVNYYPGYWSGYPGYWDAGYWGYPGWDYYFPSYYSVSRYNEKSVVIDVLDLKAPPKDENKLTAVWNAMLRGTGVWNSNNIDTMIKAVFDQSAYLKTTAN